MLTDDSTPVPEQFRLDDTTRARGLDHVRELRERLAVTPAWKPTAPSPVAPVDEPI